MAMVMVFALAAGFIKNTRIGVFVPPLYGEAVKSIVAEPLDNACVVWTTAIVEPALNVGGTGVVTVISAVRNPVAVFGPD